MDTSYVLRDMAYQTSFKRRIGLYLGTAYRAPPYGVFGVLVITYRLLGKEYWLKLYFSDIDQVIIFDEYTDVDTAYSSKSGNGLLIR
ncbi:hypothetical protein Tco_1067359 [Tanacetum coccineum]|uniref:Uncharacterized protein n=1 Tax=Tanacetum coccineum TaxID=301880 RepID=A0ABQ5HEH4_9ASTR